jgi:hypothetical protein
MKTSTSTTLRAAAGAALGAALLAACGGGGGGDAPAPAPAPVASEVPPSAQQSSSGAFQFVASVAATKNDSAEPLVVGDATLATSETDEPDPGV